LSGGDVRPDPAAVHAEPGPRGSGAQQNRLISRQPPIEGLFLA
jgi:hypothetical protein